MQMPAAYVTALDSVTRELNSARPDAPVVPHVEPAQHARALRRAVSSALYRAARAVAPAEPGPWLLSSRYR